MRVVKRNRAAFWAFAALAVAFVAPASGCGKNKLKGLKSVEDVVLYEGVPLA